MPWSDNNNSGNKGGPTRGPWGQPPKGNGDGSGGGGGRGRGEPPDLEELLQASRQRLKRAFPRGRSGRGGGDGGRSFQITPQTFAFGAFALVVLWALTGFYQIGPAEQGVTTTFGKYTGVTGPGLHWRAPMIQGVSKVPVDAQQTLEIGGGSSGQDENLMLTSDRNIVDVSFSVVWNVKREPTADGELPNVAKFIFNIENPQGLVRAVSESAMRETIGSNRLDPIITSGQAEVVEQTRQRIQATLDAYDSGIRVLRVNLNRPQAPQAVRDAFVDVIRARSEQQQMINEAQRSANQIVPVAQGDAQRLIEQAYAYAARVVAESMGEAERFNKIYEEYRRAPQVTRQRMYIETVEKVLGDMNKVIIDESAGKGVVPYLPLNELPKKN